MNKIGYTGVDLEGRKVSFSVDLTELNKGTAKPENFRVFSHPKTLEKYNFSTVLKNIAARTLSNPEFQRDASKTRIFIKITHISKEVVRYQVNQNAAKLVDEESLEIFDTVTAINQIKKFQIIPEDPWNQMEGVQPILARFAPIAEKQQRTSIFNPFSRFFHTIRDSFVYIGQIFTGITKQNQEFKWDLALLADLCGSPCPEKVSIGQALHYISSLLERERVEDRDVPLLKRMKDAARATEDIAALRTNFSKKKLDHLFDSFKTATLHLKPGEKLLLPVGYVEKGELEQQLVEICPDNQRKYTITWIGGSEKTRRWFDRHAGLKNAQSTRREITGVSQGDLFASLFSWIELQTAPLPTKNQDETSWRDTFLQTLLFEGSTVKESPQGEEYNEQASYGSLTQTLSYATQAKQNPFEARQFEVAARLRLFLDIAKHPKSLHNKEFWILVRTTGLQIAKLIEKEIGVIYDTSAVQGKELTEAYAELKTVLEQLETNLPFTPQIGNHSLGLAQTKIELRPIPASPELTPLSIQATTGYVEVEPLLQSLNLDAPQTSIQNWALRCRALLDQGQAQRASLEVQYLLPFLPKPGTDFWNALSTERAAVLLEQLAVLSEALAKGAQEKPQLTLQEIGAAAVLHIYGFTAGQKAATENQQPMPRFHGMESLRSTLLTSRLPLKNKKFLSEVFEALPLEDEWTSFLSWNRDPKKILLDSQKKLYRFTGALLGIEEHTITKYDLDTMYTCRLNPLIPDYALTIAEEIQKRHVIFDDLTGMRVFHGVRELVYPFETLHTSIEAYCPKMLREKPLARDEVAELLYLQQTNQSGSDLAADRVAHEIAFGDVCNERDRELQVFNTCMVYLDHPHFFKQADLRWLFEYKLFNAFDLLFKKRRIQANFPFIVSTIKKLVGEISLSARSGDLDTAAYLLSIAEELEKRKDYLEEGPDRTLFSSLFEGLDADRRLTDWTQNVLKKSDEISIRQQQVILPLFLNRCLDQLELPVPAEKLTLILSALGRLEGSVKGGMEVDPELKNRYRMLRALVLPQIKQQLLVPETAHPWVNSILASLHPALARETLRWSSATFPILTAQNRLNETYSFNILTGQIGSGEIKKEELPETLQKDARLKKLFGKALEDHWTLSGNVDSTTLAYEHDRFPGMRILMTKQTGLKSAAQILIQKRVKTPKDAVSWSTYLPSEAKEKKAAVKDQTPSLDLPASVASLLSEGVQAWITEDKTAIDLFRNGDKKPYARLQLKVIPGKEKAAPETMIQEVSLLEENEHLLQADKALFEGISAIEDPRFIQAWGKKKIAHTLDFYRLKLASNQAPLTYTIGPKGISTKLFPGFTLQPFGKRPGSTNPALGALPLPASFDAFHLLVKGSEQRVLIPFRELQRELNSQGEWLASSKPLLGEAADQQAVFEYTVDKTNNRLTAKNAESYGYLAYLSFVHQDYAAADFYLKKARHSVNHTTRFDQIFDWLEKLPASPLPAEAAFRLRFALFKETISSQRAAKAASKGKTPTPSEAPTKQTERLTQIADHYLTYKKKESALDPAFHLDAEEIEEAEKAVKQLLITKQDQPVTLEHPEKIRAAAIQQQSTFPASQVNLLGIRDAVSDIWLEGGNEKDISTFTLDNPKWLTQHFRPLFNQLLELAPDSLAFKQREQQIRLMAGLSDEKADRQIIAYLLKLIALKKSPDQTKLNELKGKLGGQHQLTAPSRFSFHFRRLSARNKMDLIQKHLTPASLESAAEFNQRLTPWRPSNPQERSIKQELAQIYEGLSTSPEFTKALKKALLEMQYGGLFGSLDFATELHAVFELLDTVSLPPINQTMEMIPQTPKAAAPTYQQKYGHLIADKEKIATTLVEEIASLKQTIKDMPPIGIKKREMTPRHKQKAILESHLHLHFEVRDISPPIISEQLFENMGKSTDRAVVRKAKEQRDDMHIALKGEIREVDLSQEQAKELERELTSLKNETAQERALLERDLLQEIERYATPASISAMRRLIGIGAKVTLDQLIQYWRRGEIDQEWKNHPFRLLKMKEIPATLLQKLDADITRYMTLYTREQHLTQLASLNASYLSTEPGKEWAGNPQLAKELYEGLKAKRQFSCDRIGGDPDYRDLLFLEKEQGIILRGQQVETIRGMFNDPHAVRQLRMGGGKSKVLLPLLAKAKATGKNLVMLLLPEELYETNVQDFDQTNRRLFGQKIEEFRFTRSSDRSERGLQILHKKLLKTVQSRGVVTATKKSMLSFLNTTRDLIRELGSLPEEGGLEKRTQLIGQIKAASEILCLFRDQTDVLADEVDACLDVRKEVNFALGEAIKVDPAKVAVGVELMQLILQAEEVESPLAELSQLIRSNMQATIAPTRYKEMLQALGGAFYTAHEDDFDTIEKDDFVGYLLNEGGHAKEVETWILALKETNEPLFKQLSSAKGFFDAGFGSTLHRTGNVNYGRDPINGKRTIHFKGSKSPSIGSEFDEEIERISVTIQDYVQTGVTQKQVSQLIAAFRQQGLAEMREAHQDESMTLEGTKAAAELQNFMKRIKLTEAVAKTISLNAIYSPKTIASLVEAINATPESRLAFCQIGVLEQMLSTSDQISADSTDLVDMVASFGGFTGTPWNLHTYPDKVKPAASPGVDGATWALLLGRNIPVTSFDFKPEDPIDSVLKGAGLTQKSQALIDTGAYLRSATNEQVVRGALALNPSFTGGGIYFDETDTIVKIDQAEGSALSLAEAVPGDPMKTFTFYDQIHSFGADIAQGRRAEAVVTIGEHTFIRDLFQAVWRMRQLHQEQNVRIVVSEQIKKRILGDQEGPLSIQDILEFCLTNEAQREAEDNFRAEKRKIANYGKSAALRAFTDLALKADGGQIASVAKALTEQQIFVKTRAGEEAYRQYTSLKAKEDPAHIYKSAQEAESSKCAKMIQIFAEDDVLRDLAQIVKDRPMAKEDLFPNQVLSGLQEGTEVELEQEVEMELEMELETEIEQQTELNTEKVIAMVPAAIQRQDPVNLLSQTSITALVKGKPIVCSTMGELPPSSAEYSTYLAQLQTAPVPFQGRLPFFDPGLMCSCSFEQNLPSEEGIVAPETVFYTDRKPVKQLLVAKHGDKWTALIPTIHEAHGSCRDFIAANKTSDIQAVEVALSGSKPLMLYKTGDDTTDALPFADKADQDKFYRFYIQAKLFNGEVEFPSEEEQAALRAWLAEKGAAQFKQYFEKYILASKPGRFGEAYPKSSLFKLLTEVDMPIL